ncbi:MAG: hypothetical protein P8J68_08295 [Arenicellaceae bacterium]|nr:hypothetical protein [Arenicellaceae bacterium]
MFELWFRYPLSTWQEAERIFDTEWPIDWLLIALPVTFILVFAWLLVSQRTWGVGKTLCIACLQWFVITGLLLLLWKPSLRMEQLVAEQNSVAFMLDTSASMDYLNQGASRIDQAKAIFDDSAIKTLRDIYSSQLWSFSNDAQMLDGLEFLPPPGKETQLATSVISVLEQARSDSLTAIIVFSDGSDSNGGVSEELLNEIADYNIPVHTVGIGRTEIVEDLEIERLDLPVTVLPNSVISASIRIRHDAPGLARLKVYDGDQYLASQEIVLDPESDVTVTSIEFELLEDGYRDIDFRLDRLEQEINVENNHVNQLIEVVERRYKVLYAEGEPRWEYKFLRRAFDDDPVVNLISLLWVSDNKFFRQGIQDEVQLDSGFPLTKDELYDYDAILIGSVEAPRFTSEQQQMIHDFVSERGGSLLMIAGRKGLAAGGWDHSIVGDSLPVTLDSETEIFVRDKARVSMTPVGAMLVSLKLADNAQENMRLWSELPELSDYQTIGELKPAASTLLNAQVSIDGNTQTLPLLVSQPYGLGKTMVLATSGTWRWQMGLPAADLRHETFWRQTIRALVAVAPTRFDLHAEQIANQVHIRAELKSADYSPMTDIRLTTLLEGIGSEGINRRVELIPSYGEPGVYEANFESSSAGVIYMDAIASRDGEALDSAQTAIQVIDSRSEFFNIRQDQSQLTILAEQTGGRYWNADDLSELPNAVARSRSGITQATILPLWNLPLWLVLLVALKLAEWLLRRRWGHI